MQHRFFALISRMRYIGRWGLMRNTFEENIQEHSHMVAVLAHGLAVIQRDILGQPADPDRCASAALFHDASEILTGDLPTPIKYYNPEIKKAYKQIEAVSCEKLLALLPPEVQESYRPLLFESDPEVARIVKAADKLSAYIKCVEELKAGNSEFEAAEKQTRQALVEMQLVEMQKEVVALQVALRHDRLAHDRHVPRLDGVVVFLQAERVHIQAAVQVRD